MGHMKGVLVVEVCRNLTNTKHFLILFSELIVTDINISPQHPLSVPYHTNFVHTLFISEDVLKICCTAVVVVVFVQEVFNGTPLMLLLLGDLFLGYN